MGVIHGRWAMWGCVREARGACLLVHTGWLLWVRLRQGRRTGACVCPDCGLLSHLYFSGVVEGNRVGTYLARTALCVSRGVRNPCVLCQW